MKLSKQANGSNFWPGFISGVCVALLIASWLVGPVISDLQDQILAVVS